MAGKKICESPMMIHKITSSVDYNWWLKHLDIQLNEPTNQISIIIPKVVKQTNNKKILFVKLWGLV